MSTPSTPPPSTQGYDRPYYGSGLQSLPVISGELVVFFLVWAVVAIMTLAARSVHAEQFVWVSVVLAAAYMIGRGIAKAGKVLEGR